MARDEDGQEDGHPVLWGVVALVAVALVIGVVFGGAALLGTRVLGLGNGEPVGGQATADDSLYLPTPSTTQRTPTPSEEATTPSGGASAPAPSAASSSAAAAPITLVAGQSEVSSFGRIDLSGSYPDGEGAVLEVQRREGKRWAPFYSVTAVVVSGQFATVVQTSRAGVSAFRVVDSDTGKASNPVRVTVS